LETGLLSPAQHKLDVFLTWLIKAPATPRAAHGRGPVCWAEEIT
jgi:hypothetical protein